MACHTMPASNKVLNNKVLNSQILGVHLPAMLSILRPYPPTMVLRQCSNNIPSSNYHNSHNQDIILGQDPYQSQVLQWHMHFLSQLHQTILHSVPVRFRHAYIPVSCFQTKTSSHRSSSDTAAVILPSTWIPSSTTSLPIPTT